VKEEKGRHEFQQIKERKRRELKKKKKEMCIEGRGTPSDLTNTCAVDKRGSLNWHLDLQSIEEEREDSGSRAPSMA
jgi:hypothetical protein